MNGLHTRLTLDQHREHLGNVQMALERERSFSRAVTLYAAAVILGLIGIIGWLLRVRAC